MGTWRLESIRGSAEPGAGNICGHDVIVVFQMRYTPGFFGKFKETPELDWYEKITTLDHHKSEYWQFGCNQYFRNPTSRTMETWARRYIDAYSHAIGEVPAKGKPPPRTTLLDVRGMPVEAGALPSDLEEPEARRDAVREYLRLRGGILEITIHDIPTIHAPENGRSIRRERLLEFNVGVVGNPMYRWRGAQHLLFDNTTGVIRHSVDFRPGMRPLSTAGLNLGPPNALAVKFNSRKFEGSEAAGFVL